jgi:O-antigen/teichoic acid export membrane protein
MSGLRNDKRKSKKTGSSKTHQEPRIEASEQGMRKGLPLFRSKDEAKESPLRENAVPLTLLASPAIDDHENSSNCAMIAEARAFGRRALSAGVTWGFCSVAVRALSAVVLLPLTTCLVPTEQLALWYIFTTVLTFGISMDLGITNAAGRRLAAISNAPGHAANSNEASLEDYLGHLRLIYWGLAISTFTILAFGGGWWVWHRTAEMADGQIVRTAWLCFCPSFLLGVIGNEGRALLYGTNRLKPYYVISSVAVLLQFALTLGGLLLGFSIMSLVAGNVAFFAIQAITNPIGRHRFGRSEAGLIPKPFRPHLISTLFKTSFSTFLNSFAAYLVLCANVLVASKYLSLAETASYGMTLQILLLCSQVSSVWIGVKHPLYATMSRDNLPGLRQIIIGRLRLALLTFAAVSGGLLLFGNPLLELIGARTHLLPAPQAATLALFVLLYFHQSEFETLGLCLEKNPFVRQVLATAIIGLALSCYFAPHFGLWGIILGPFIAQIALNNWWIVATGLRMIDLRPTDYVRRLLRPACLQKR